MTVFFLVTPTPEQFPRIYDFILKGGPVMFPLLGFSVVVFACALERIWFWLRLVSHERQIVKDVLSAATENMDEAIKIASYAKAQPIGRFLLAPLRLFQPTPDTFRLALEAAADREFVRMRRGDKILETIVSAAPLLGLLGTVTGLIRTFSNLRIGSGSGAVTEQATQAAQGIGEALITTAAGMIVAIIALLFLRLFSALQANQMDYFTEVGNQLEIIYRQVWYEPRFHGDGLQAGHHDLLTATVGQDGHAEDQEIHHY